MESHVEVMLQAVLLVDGLQKISTHSTGRRLHKLHVKKYRLASQKANRISNQPTTQPMPLPTTTMTRATSANNKIKSQCRQQQQQELLPLQQR